MVTTRCEGSQIVQTVQVVLLWGEFTGHRLWIPLSKDQLRGAMMFSLVYASAIGRTNSGVFGDLRHVLCDVTLKCIWWPHVSSILKVPWWFARQVWSGTPITTFSWASYQIRKITGCACAGMPGTFSSPPRVSDPDTYHGTCMTHVPWCMPGSLTSGFLWSRSRGKRSRHSRRMRNPQFSVYLVRGPLIWYVRYRNFGPYRNLYTQPNQTNTSTPGASCRRNTVLIIIIFRVSGTNNPKAIITLGVLFWRKAFTNWISFALSASIFEISRLKYAASYGKPKWYLIRI